MQMAVTLPSPDHHLEEPHRARSLFMLVLSALFDECHQRVIRYVCICSLGHGPLVQSGGSLLRDTYCKCIADLGWAEYSAVLTIRQVVLLEKHLWQMLCSQAKQQ